MDNQQHLDNQPQFARQIPEVAQRAQEAGPEVARLLSGLDFLAEIPDVSHRQFSDGTRTVEVYPMHEFHEDKHPLTEKETIQANITSHYIELSVAELGEDASEKAIWDQVFELQLDDFVRLNEVQPDSAEVENLALSIAVGDLLATRTLGDEEKADVFDKRMWQIAQTKHGASFLAAAQRNIGFCVADEQPPVSPEQGRPVVHYSSVMEQVQDYSSLLEVTDIHRTLDAPVAVDALRTADPEEAKWFFEALPFATQRNTIETNFRLLDPDTKRIVALDLVDNGWSPGHFAKETFGGLGGVFEPKELVDMLIDRGEVDKVRYYTRGLADEDVGPVFDKLVTIGDSSVIGDFMNDIRYDHPATIEASYMPKIHEAGVKLELSTFKNFSPGDIDWLLNNEDVSNYDLTTIADRIGKEGQEQIVNNLLSRQPPEYNEILYAIDSFGQLPALELIARIKAVDPEMGLGVYITDKIITSFDRETIVAALDLAPKDISSIVSSACTHIENEEDRQWLLDKLMKQGFLSAVHQQQSSFAEIMTAEQQQTVFDYLFSEESSGYIISDKIPDFNKLDRNQMTEAMIKSGDFGVIIENLDFLANEGDTTALLNRILDNGQGLYYIAVNPELIKRIGAQNVFDRVKENQNAANGVMFSATTYAEEGVSVDDIMEMAFSSDFNMNNLFGKEENAELVKVYGADRLWNEATEKGMTHALIGVMDLFENPDQRRAIIEGALEQGNIFSITDNIRRNPDVLPMSREELRTLLINKGYASSVFSNPGVYFEPNSDGSDTYFGWTPPLDTTELIKQGAATALLFNSNKFKPAEVRDYLRQSISDGFIDLAAENFRYYYTNLGKTELDQDIVQKFAEAGHVNLLMKFQTLTGAPNAELVEAAIASDAEGSRAYYQFFKEKTGQSIAWLETGIRLLGDESPIAALSAAKLILDETGSEQLPDYLSDIGVNKRGEPGVNQLKASVSKIRGVFLSVLETGGDESQLNLLRDNKIARGYGKQLVRFSESEFGSGGDDEWQKIIDGSIGARETAKPMPESFVPSEIVSIRTRDRAKVEAIKIRPDVTEQFSKFQDDVVKVLDLSDQSQTGGGTDRLPSRIIMSSAVEILETYRSGIIEQLATSLPDKAKQNLSSRLSSIDELLSSDITDNPMAIIKSLDKVAGIKVNLSGDQAAEKVSIDPLLRQLAIALVVERDTSAVVHNARTLKAAKPTIDNIAFMQEFVDDNVVSRLRDRNQLTPESSKALGRLLNTTSFGEQTDEVKKLDFDSSSTMQFVPTRGLMLELSGHFSDACWASKYDSIAEAYPDISALVMVRNKGESSERIVGSTLLIDSVDEKTGEPVIVIRGLNPIQNYVMDIDLENFTDQLMAQVKSMAGDKRVAMVIDGSSGGALSNRPSLFKYITERYAAAIETESLELPEDTTFNNYVLSKQGGHPAFYIE